VIETLPQMIVMMRVIAITMVNVLIFRPLGFQPNSVSVTLDGLEKTASGVRFNIIAYMCISDVIITICMP